MQNNLPYFVAEKRPPSLVFLDLDNDEKFEYDTGPASEDTISLTYSVVSTSQKWTEFIKVEIDELDWSAKIKVEPFKRLHKGKYEIRLVLEDNASDRKEGLTDYETALPAK